MSDPSTSKMKILFPKPRTTKGLKRLLVVICDSSKTGSNIFADITRGSETSTAADSPSK